MQASIADARGSRTVGDGCQIAGAELVLQGLAGDVAREAFQQHGIGQALIFGADPLVRPFDQRPRVDPALWKRMRRKARREPAAPLTK